MEINGPRDRAWHDDLYRRYWAEIVKWLARWLYPRDQDAEDLAQQTFTTAWDKRRKVPDNPRPWLYKTAQNHLRNYRRKRAWSEEPLGDEPVGGDGGIAESELTHDVRAALNRLTSSERDVLDLGYLRDFSVEEIAEILRLTTSAVKQRRLRARHRLRDVLEDMDGPGADDCRRPAYGSAIANGKYERRRGTDG